MSLLRRFTLFMPKLIVVVGLISRRSKKRFYLGLATLFSIATMAYFGVVTSQQGSAFLQYDTDSIDLAYEYRLKQPSADEDIILIDVDERSLALMANEFGRWPWPRFVFGEFLAGLADTEVGAVALNVMFSDPDLRDVESDALLAEMSGYARQVAFPMTRLSAENDGLSEVKLSQLPGVVLPEAGLMDETVAVLYPYFAEAHDRLGINNLVLDDDGVVRRFQPMFYDKNFAFPSLAKRTIDIFDANISSELKDEYLVNWRPYNASYSRYSFFDIYSAMAGEGDFDLGLLKGKIIVIGATAPGLALLKANPLSNTVDDNFMIANFIDDMKNNTGLTPIPVWMIVLFSCFGFWCLAIAHVYEVDEDVIDSVFIVAEVLSVLVTLISMSYTTVAIDLVFPVLMGIAFFSVSKLYSIPVRGSRRGTRLFFDEIEWTGAREALLLGYFNEDSKYEREVDDLESRVGAKKVFCIDNLFSGENLTADIMGSTRYVLVLDHEGGALDGSELIESAGKLVRIISVVGTHLEARTSVSKAMLDMAVEFMANKATMPTSQSD
ncbi:CHASE2 domain-containing protein [Pseudomonadales bacterium]|jgi:adenylate cyclase|nr:CHASE2 domain-containing protein [Pseudomonadales bacterium]